MSRVIRVCPPACLLVALSLPFVDLGMAQEPETRAAVPSKDVQAESLKLVREIFADDRATAKTPQQKSDLAQKLLKQAGESKDGSANQFVLLRVAYDLAISAGDATTTSTAIDEVTAAFKIEPKALRLAASQKLREKARSSTQRKALGKIAAQWAGEALAADDYTTGQSMISTALSMARLVRDVRLVRSLAAQQKMVAASAKAFAAAETALKTLRDRPTDPAANLEAGRYYCFVKHDWETGIAMLALGGESELAKVAQRDLAAKPGDKSLVAVADAWWALAQKEDGRSAKNALLSRASVRYRQALPTLQGLTRVRVDKRVAEVKHLLADSDTAKLPGPSTDFDIKKDLVLYLSFDKDTVTEREVSDLSPSKNRIQINGPMRLVPGRRGQAASFEGGFMNVPRSKELAFHDFTLAAWIRTRQRVERPDTGAILSTRGNDPDGGPWFELRYHSVVVHGGEGDSYPVALNDGRWHFLTYVKKGTLHRVFGDSRLLIEKVIRDPRPVAGEGPIHIGRSLKYKGKTFGLYQGHVDELMIFDRPFSKDEVRQLYTRR